MPETTELPAITNPSVQDIVGRQPAWLVRSGLAVSCLAMLLLMSVSWFVKYPRVLQAPITLYGDRPPVQVVARKDGEITTMLVADGDLVSAGDDLALLAFPANYHHIKALKLQLQKLRAFYNDPNAVEEIQMPMDPNLGALSQPYTSFLKAFTGYRDLVAETYTTERIQELERQIADHQHLAQRYQRELLLKGQELSLLETKLKNDRHLFEKQMISETDFSQVRSQTLQMKQSLEQLERERLENNIQITTLNLAIRDARQRHKDQVRERLSQAQETLSTLHTAFDQWERENVLQASTDGQVSLFTVWGNHQQVREGEVVLTLLPPNGTVEGRLNLPQRGSGTLKPGMTVNVKLDSYPFEEFGMLVGEVTSISRMSRDDVLLVNVQFPEGLTTTLGRKLELLHQMRGASEIVTEDLRLMERIFYQFRHLWHQRT